MAERSLLARTSDLAGGLVIGLVMAVSFLSYVALVFSGPLLEGQGIGLVMVAPGVLLIGIGTVWFSRALTPLGVPDGNVIAVMASLAATIAAGTNLPADRLIATVVAGLALTSLAIGVALVVLAKSGAGRLVRFLPLQLNVAFEGTAGWLFASGGIGLALGSAGLGDMLSDGDVAAKVLATCAGAILLVAVGRVPSARLAVPTAIIGLIVLHHLVFFVLSRFGFSAADWMLVRPSVLGLAPAWVEPVTFGVDWGVLADNFSGLTALTLLGVVTIIVNLIGQEEMDGIDLDMDRELATAGWTSLFSAALGGFSGSLNPENGRLLRDAGGGSRWSIAVAVLLAGLLPLIVPQVLTGIPVTVLGAVLLSMGLKFGAEWVLSSSHHLTWTEWPTVLVVVGIAVTAGPVAALLAGLVFGTIGFALVYARTPPIAARSRGDLALSCVERPAEDMDYLKAHAAARLVLHLQGYLFFGTAARVEEEVRDQIARAGGEIDTVVLDFAEVDGIDVSAAAAIEALARYARRRGAILVLAAMPLPVYQRILGQERTTRQLAQVFATLDQALEWTEERVLSRRTITSMRRSAHDPLADLLAETLALTPVDMAAGTVLIQQGDLSDDLFFVLSGRVGITLRHGTRPPVRVRTFTAGTMVGEIGFFLGSERTASVIAEEDCRVLVLRRVDLERLKAEHPGQALQLMARLEERLCQRIRDKDYLIDGLLRSSRYQKGN